VYRCERDTPLEGEIVRSQSMNLSLTLSKTEQHIMKKTHKVTVLSFWVECDVKVSYMCIELNNCWREENLEGMLLLGCISL